MLNLKLELGVVLLSIKTLREVSVVFSSSFIGKDDETIEESHIYKLPFLQAIVKKTIGLHPPPGPLLIM